MKVVIYRLKENNNIKNINILTDYQIQTIEKNDSLNKYNKNNEKQYVSLYEIGVSELPQGILEFLIINYCNRKQTKINDIYEKLQTLEDNIYELSSDISNIKYDIEEVLGND